MKYPGDVPLDAAEIEHWVIVFTNEERAKAGLHPLETNTEIAAIAKAHSANMAQQETAKTRLDGKNASARARAAGYNCTAAIDGKIVSGLAENVIKHSRIQVWGVKREAGVVVRRWPTVYDADSKAVARALVDHWLSNQSTRATLLRDRYRRTGIGVTIDVSVKQGWFLEKVYAAQDFSSCR